VGEIMARPVTSELTRTEQLRVNQSKCQKSKKDKGDVRLEIWLPTHLRDELTNKAKTKGISRSEYILSLLECPQK
jgi:hypothetical protein